MHDAGSLYGVEDAYNEIMSEIKKGNKIKKLSLCLIIAGALSNIFDRFTRGYVVDYIRIKVKGLDKVIFNLGDIFILVGSLMMPFGTKKKIKEIPVDTTATEE